MAGCTICFLEMTDLVSCVDEPRLLADGTFPPIRYGRERRLRKWGPPAAHCGDCGTPLGGVHHLGCDVERCPRCRRQLITCSCDPELDEEDLASEGLGDW